MAYATPADVEAMFPRFVPNSPGGVQDSQIMSWLEDASGQVHAIFYSRGIDCNSLSNPIVGQPTLTTPVYDQAAILRDMVRAYGSWKLGQAIWNTLSPAEQALARGQYDRWNTQLKSIQAGIYDKLFFIGAATIDIFPQFEGVGGAEVPYTSPYTPPNGSNRYFWKDQRY